MLGRTAIRFALEAALIVAAAVAAGVEHLRWTAIVLVMVLTYVVVATAESVISRRTAATRRTRRRPSAPPPRTALADELSTLSGEGVRVLETAAKPRSTASERAESEADGRKVVPERPVVTPVSPPAATERRDVEPAVATAAPEAGLSSEPRTEPEPPTPSPEPEAEPAPPPLVLAASPSPPEPSAEAPAAAAAPPEAVEQANVIVLPTSGPRAWNIWDLERLAREHAGRDSYRDEERGYLLVYLRDFATPEGLLPVDFDDLVRESFGELVSTG